MKRREELTVHEIESNNGAIRESPVIDRFAHPQDRIPQRHEVTDSGTRPKILQVWSSGATLTFSPEVFELLFGRSDLGVQLITILFVELPRDGLVDVLDHRVLPERVIFILGVETGNLSRADDNTRSANRIETTM